MHAYYERGESGRGSAASITVKGGKLAGNIGCSRHLCTVLDLMPVESKSSIIPIH